MRCAELFKRSLENEGVEYIIVIPGEENLDVMDALLWVIVAVIYCPVDYSENMKLAGKLGELVCPI